jgi:hypothetical protein
MAARRTNLSAPDSPAERSAPGAGPRPVCWVLSDGKPGSENQSRGLAAALGLAPEVKRIAARLPWRALPPLLWFRPLAAPGPGSAAVAAPWPRLVIASGRQTVAVAAAIRRRSRGASFVVQLQDPGVPLARFDLVVAPEHDGLSGPNVIATKGSLHGVTDRSLAAAAARFAPRLSHLPRPLVAVLVGGPNRAYRLDGAAMAALAAMLQGAVAASGAGLVVTASRRTGADARAALGAGLAGLGAEIWDGTGDNPYLGYLALADAIVVTSDSVNMVSEACATGKPVHVFMLPGGSAKFRRFHDSFRAAGFTRPFAGTIGHWTYAPPRETERVAAEIRRRAGLPAMPAPDGASAEAGEAIDLSRPAP